MTNELAPYTTLSINSQRRRLAAANVLVPMRLHGYYVYATTFC